jgi:hypothetical protein
MAQKTNINRLELLINKIAVDKGDMKLVQAVVDELRVQCNVQPITVKRWMRNLNQPSTQDVFHILSVLNRYNSDITIMDFFHAIPVTSNLKVHKRSQQFVK